ncbi:MAG: hypothetical protein HW421_887 [Ignavibacteria bacterium]|nr:hypothetical protein [Ignavibacteria bacterium]
MINENMQNIPIKHLVSKRDISIEAFELENGNLMLHAVFLDPYHLIRLNLHIVPQTKTIVGAFCEYANNPHRECPVVALKAAQLIGLRIERGITKKVSERIGGSEGCVHLRELVLETINFSATALIGYDEGFGLMSRSFNILDEDKRYELSKNVLKNTCYIYKEK